MLTERQKLPMSVIKRQLHLDLPSSQDLTTLQCTGQWMAATCSHAVNALNWSSKKWFSHLLVPDQQAEAFGPDRQNAWVVPAGISVWVPWWRPHATLAAPSQSCSRWSSAFPPLSTDRSLWTRTPCRTCRCSLLRRGAETAGLPALKRRRTLFVSQWGHLQGGTQEIVNQPNPKKYHGIKSTAVGPGTISNAGLMRWPKSTSLLRSSSQRFGASSSSIVLMAIRVACEAVCSFVSSRTLPCFSISSKRPRCFIRAICMKKTGKTTIQKKNPFQLNQWGQLMLKTLEIDYASESSLG